MLSACSEVEFASHVVKTSRRSHDTPQQQGTFKVGKPYQIDGTWYYPKEAYEHEETGLASWYGPGFHGKKTANGETFNKNELTAAHRTLQMPSLVRVTNLDNGKSVIVRVNDRGPYKRGRVMDVSEKAADLLGFKNIGTAKVKLQVLTEDSLNVADAARQGQDTRGYELASADKAKHAVSYQTASYQPADGPALGMDSVSRETLQAGPVQGHFTEGQFYPDPVVSQMPVTSSHIYIQAGSFTVQDNAVNLSQKLQGFASADVFPTQVNGRQFYRVRLGPVRSVEEADSMLARLVENGYKNSIIVVE